MSTKSASKSKPHSRRLLLGVCIIALAGVLLIVATPWILDYFSASEEQVGDNDSDNDGVPDDLDVFPHDPSEWADTDKDGIGDNVDDNQDGHTPPFPNPPPIDPADPFP